MSAEPDAARPLYSISVAAELAGLALPTLRLYEQHGLIEPARTHGGTRRYSDADVARLLRIKELVASGVTLAATARVLDLEDHNTQLADANDALRSRNRQLHRDNTRLRRRDRADRDGTAG
jgi:MerR family transcriptional regulator, heat shock protein HspR